MATAATVVPAEGRWTTLVTALQSRASTPWLIAAAMFAAALAYIGQFGFTFPYRDEMEWVGVLVGEQPVTLSWLWSQHSEHRMFLPRLIYVAVTTVTGGNLRVGAMYNAIVLGAISVLLMAAARRLRGSTRLSDAFFPLAFLHWGHFTNLVWVFQLNFVTAAALTAVLLAAVLRTGERLSLRLAALVSLCLVLMVLCGAYGMAYVPAMSAWMGLAAIVRWRDGQPACRRDALLLIMLAMLPVAAVGIYFTGYVRPAIYPDADLLSRLRTALQTLSSCLGPAARQIWPASGIAVLAGLVLLIGALLAVWRQKPQERLRTSGLCCYLGGVLCLALGIGWGRAALGDDAGFTDRYILLATPLLTLGYLLAVAAGAGQHGRRVQVALLVLLVALLPVNVRKGYRTAADFHSRFVALERDIRAGLPIAGLACRHAYIYPSEQVLQARLESLRRVRFGAFAEANEAGPLSHVSVVPLSQVPQWNDAAGQLRLKAGESLTREFQLAAGQQLSWIEVQASLRRGRTAAALHWSLARIEAGQPTVLCQGEEKLDQLDNQRFFALPCSVQMDKDSTLRLTLEVPAAAAANQYVEFPTFRTQQATQQELNVFLFTQPAAGLAQKYDAKLPLK